MECPQEHALRVATAALEKMFLRAVCGRGVLRKEQLEKEKENIKSAFFSEFLHTHTPFILWSEITGKVLRNVFRSSYLKPNGRKKKKKNLVKL